MASTARTIVPRSSPFTKAVVNSMQKLYPESLADKSFDNTGLLLDAPTNLNTVSSLKNSVLLAIDLTTEVAEEAIERRCSAIVAYHPIIFRGMKSLTQSDSQQRSLLRLAAEGISVYCPHTAVDAAAGGNADWLADVVTGTAVRPELEDDDIEAEEELRSWTQRPQRFRGPVGSRFEIHQYPSATFEAPHVGFKPIPMPHTRDVIKPAAAGSAREGMGRIVNFPGPMRLASIINNVAGYLGDPKAISIALPSTQTAMSERDLTISRVGICAGSGGSLLMPLGSDVDMLLTGELSHHEALAATQRGCTVLCTGHSNSERSYLRSIMRPKLQEALASEWKECRKQALPSEDKAAQTVLARGDQIKVRLSELDQDPFGHVLVNDGI